MSWLVSLRTLFTAVAWMGGRGAGRRTDAESEEEEERDGVGA